VFVLFTKQHTISVHDYIPNNSIGVMFKLLKDDSIIKSFHHKNKYCEYLDSVVVAPRGQSTATFAFGFGKVFLPELQLPKILHRTKFNHNTNMLNDAMVHTSNISVLKN
jgi:hypothetical protein